MNKVLEQTLSYAVSSGLSILRTVGTKAEVHVVVKFGPHLDLLMPESAIPVVLDRIIGAPEEHIGELSPAILGIHLQDEEDPVFFNAPLILHDEWVQMVIPSLAALLTSATRDLRCDLIPRAWTYHAYKLDKTFVGLTIPGKLGGFRSHLYFQTLFTS